MIREAINELKKYTLGRKNTEKVEISVLQINRVIKALEQEPCDDTISRQAAIDALYHVDEYNGQSVKAIRNLPATQTEYKKGQWIDKKYRWIKSISIWWSDAYECSVCGEAGIKDWKFCPNCGARMEVE